MSDNDPAADEAGTDQEQHLEAHLKSRSTWLRCLFMCIYAVLFWLTGLVGVVVVVIGFLWVLFTGEANAQLRQVGQGIAAYMYEIVRYLTYNTDARPFPFGEDWPVLASAGDN